MPERAAASSRAVSDVRRTMASLCGSPSSLVGSAAPARIRRCGCSGARRASGAAARMQGRGLLNDDGEDPFDDVARIKPPPQPTPPPEELDDTSSTFTVPPLSGTRAAALMGTAFHYSKPEGGRPRKSERDVTTTTTLLGSSVPETMLEAEVEAEAETRDTDSLVAAPAAASAPEPPASCAAVTVIALACFCTFAMGGVVFGISSLYPVLYRQGFWRSLCAAEQSSGEGADQCEDSATKCCDAQLVRFSLVASAAFFCTDVAAAPWGVLADTAGARTCLAMAVLLSCSGLLLLGVGSASESDGLTTCAMLLLGLAGPGVFNGGYMGGLDFIGEERPKLRATLASCLAAVFDGSSLVFLLLQAATALVGSLAAPTGAWAALCAAVGGSFWLMLGARRASTAPAQTSTQHAPELEAAAESTASESGRELLDGTARAPADGARAPPSLRGALCAASNVQLVCFMAAYNLISSYYLETQIDYFEDHFGEGVAERLSGVFNLAFPIGGLAAAMPAAALLRRHGSEPAVYWGVCAALALTFALLSLLPTQPTQLLGALIFGPIRCLQWACYFQFLADERLYPPQIMGRALGLNNSLVALVGDLVPYLLTYLTATDGWGGSLTGRYLRIKLGGFVALLLVVGGSAAHGRRRRAREGRARTASASVEMVSAEDDGSARP